MDNNEDLNKKINELFSYLVDQEKYKEEILFCVINKFWDLAVIITWKIFILFLYEHFLQIPKDFLIEKWNKKFYKSNGKSLSDEVNLENQFWPNEKDDDLVITFLKELYPIEENVIKQARILLNDRNQSAHVRSFKCGKNEFISFLEKTIRILDIIEKNHTKYLEQYIKNGGKYLSGIQVVPVIEININTLLQSSSFNQAEEREKHLENYLEFFREKDLKTLLLNSLDTRWTINQVLGAGYTPYFLDKLFERTKNFINIWWKFKEGLESRKLENDYKDLIGKIEIEFIPF